MDTLQGWDGFAKYPNALENPFHTVVRTRRPTIELVAGTITHEIGHNFSLVHTSDCPQSGLQTHSCGKCKQESVSRTRTQGLLCNNTGDLKCEINGDALCDTEADPELRVGDNVQITPNGCVFTASASGNVADEEKWGAPWTPDVTNIMGLADECRAGFTPMQTAVMQLTIASRIPNYWQRVENDFDVFEPDNYPESASEIALDDIQCHTSTGARWRETSTKPVTRTGFASNPVPSAR